MSMKLKQDKVYCEKCNEKVKYNIIKENLRRLYSKYRELTGIISPQDIIDFRAKHNISQTELVAILDWGMMTINRYERGSIPNQIHSDILKLIIKDESYFREKVEDAYKCKRINEKTYNFQE